MGWSFQVRGGRLELLQRLRSPNHLSPGYKKLADKVVRNRYWFLFETPKGDRRIGVELMKGGGKTLGWGNKGMSEDEGPHYYDCPLAFLDAAGEPRDEYVAAWRQKVRDYHAARAIKKEEGQVWVTPSGCTVTLLAPLGRRGWMVKVDNGITGMLPSTELLRKAE